MSQNAHQPAKVLRYPRAVEPVDAIPLEASTPAEPEPPPGTPPRRHRHIWAAALASGALVALVGTAIELLREPAGPPPPTLLLAPVTRGRVIGAVQAPGTLEALQTSTVSSAIPGRLVDVVAVGAKVTAGQVLARLDPLRARAELARAEARLVAAEAASVEAEVSVGALLRTEDLQYRSSVPDSEEAEDTADNLVVWQARAARAAAEVNEREAAYRLAVQRSKQVVVRSPVEGVVVAGFAEPGQTVDATAPLFRVAANPSRLKLMVEVPEKEMGDIRVGQTARFGVPARPGRGYQGRVLEVGLLHGAAGTRSVPVTVAVSGDPDGLSVGMSAAVVLETATEPAVWRVPLAALRYAPGAARGTFEDPGVFLRGTAEEPFVRVPVELGVADGTFAEVRASGLREGAAVVVGEGQPAK
jgi:HlyD family secretion protein